MTASMKDGDKCSKCNNRYICDEHLEFECKKDNIYLNYSIDTNKKDEVFDVQFCEFILNMINWNDKELKLYQKVFLQNLCCKEITMDYRAEIYKDGVLKNTVRANGLEVLKSKCEPFIKDDKITSIEVSEIKSIGYFKLPKEIADIIEKEKLL